MLINICVMTVFRQLDNNELICISETAIRNLRDMEIL